MDADQQRTVNPWAPNRLRPRQRVVYASPARPPSPRNPCGPPDGHTGCTPDSAARVKPAHAASAARPLPSVETPTVAPTVLPARNPSAIRPWTPQHDGLQRDKVTHHGPESASGGYRPSWIQLDVVGHGPGSQGFENPPALTWGFITPGHFFVSVVAPCLLGRTDPAIRGFSKRPIRRPDAAPGSLDQWSRPHAQGPGVHPQSPYRYRHAQCNLLVSRTRMADT
jgi:hypothetical protein